MLNRRAALALPGGEGRGSELQHYPHSKNPGLDYRIASGYDLICG
jgi:hypothetical protein